MMILRCANSLAQIPNPTSLRPLFAKSPIIQTIAHRGISSRLFLRSDYPQLLVRPIGPFTSQAYTLGILTARGIHLKRDFHSYSRLWQEQRQESNGDGQQHRDPKPNAEDISGSYSSANSKSQNTRTDQEGNGKKSGKKAGEKESAPPPPPPHGDKSAWKVFTETLHTEFEASKEWKESTKALASSANQFSESESVKRARAAYNAASGAASSTTSSALKATGKVVGKGAAWTWETPVVKGVRAGVKMTGSVVEKGTRPVRETEAYKKAVGGVKEFIDDGSTRYGGWVEKEERRKKRLLEMSNDQSGLKAVKMEEDPNAGTNVTLHKDTVFKEQWKKFRDTNPVVQSIFSLKSSYEESENPIISTARSISDRVASFFAENETAQVIKKFREMDANFQLEPFLREMREYILPEVLDAYVKGDNATLKLWLSDAQFSVYAALSKQINSAGLTSDGRILDIRGVDVMTARMLDPGDIPVFVITCRTQEVHVYRNTKTGALAAGMEDRVQLVNYAIGVTRIPEDVNNPETRGWRLIELQKSARDYI